MAVVGLLLVLWVGSLQRPLPWRPRPPSPPPLLPPAPWATRCLEGACWALFWAPRTFPQASLECLAGGGRLLTVGSREAAEALEGLYYQRGAPERAWLGLRLPEGSCREAGKRLRGFQWVSGEERSDYAAWADSFEEEEGPLCGGAPLCVAVTPGLLWEERRCQSPAEGFLCEYSYPGGTCGPLNPGPASEAEGEEETVVVVYRTPFGAEESDLLALPPGSSALLPKLGLSLECRPQPEGASPKWASSSRGAWDCRVENGGCQGQCHSRGGPAGQPYCSCPQGSALLEEDRRGCGSPCALLGCQHRCVVLQGGSASCLCFPGFQMVGGKCQEEEARRGCSDLGCQQDCAVVEGSPRCLCFEGYTPDPEKPQQCLLLPCNWSQCPPRCDTAEECYCPEGFVLEVTENGTRVCSDIDECESGYCQGLECRNEPGGYDCVCPDSGALVKDKGLCGEGREQGTPSPPLARLRGEMEGKAKLKTPLETQVASTLEE